MIQFIVACVCTCNTLSPFYLRCANRWEFNESNHRCTLRTLVSAIAPDSYGFSLLGDGAFKGRPNTRLQVRKVWNYQPHKVLKFQTRNQGDSDCDYSVTFVQIVKKYSRTFFRQSSATFFLQTKKWCPDALIPLFNYLHGHYSLCYFVHKHLNNAWYNKAHLLIGKPYLTIIASNGISLKLFCETAK